MITRRQLFACVAAIPFLRQLKTRAYYGEMDIDRWFHEGHYGKHTFCNGVDITDRCRWFDDRIGVAECYLLPAQINNYGDDAKVERLYGRIEVRGEGIKR